MVPKHRERLYRLFKDKARGTRNREIRIKIELFCLALKIGNVSEACSRRGFSRRFYYRWWRRFKRSGYELSALREYSRRPRRSPNLIPKQIEQRILWYANRQNLGSRMIEAMLGREGIRVSRSTICHVLRRRRRHRPLKRRHRLKAHNKRYELYIPGQRLQVDVKYVPELIEGQKAFCYVAIDECTRWRYAETYRHIDASNTVEFLQNLMKAVPFPIHTIQTDNGFEFTYRLNPHIGPETEHPMDEWCRTQGIRHRLIPPGEKELNGKVERSHRIDEQYFYWRAPTESFTQFKMEHALWIRSYNQRRLHGGIGYQTPLEMLHERQKALKPLPSVELPEDLERHRLNFLKTIPKSRPKADADPLLRLSRKLDALLKAA
jgi:transposase InsO family protein